MRERPNNPDAVDLAMQGWAKRYGGSAFSKESLDKEVGLFERALAIDPQLVSVGFVAMIRKRAGWLCALFLAEMLTASAMQTYESELEKAVVLALFIPLIMSSGGNSGGQATSLVIRALALREVRLGDWWRVLLRELPSGLALGAILGVIGATLSCSSSSSSSGRHSVVIAQEDIDPLRADRGALDRVSHIVLGRRVPLQTASLFVVRDRLIAAEDAVADVTVVDRACLNRQMRRDRARNPVFDLRCGNADDRSSRKQVGREPCVQGRAALAICPSLRVDDRRMKAVVDLPFVTQPSDILRV